MGFFFFLILKRDFVAFGPQLVYYLLVLGFLGGTVPKEAPCPVLGRGGGDKYGTGCLTLPQSLRTPLSCLGLSFLIGLLGGSWDNPVRQDN